MASVPRIPGGLALLLLAGCAAPRPPDLACTAPTRWGTVYAADSARAERGAADLERVAPSVQAALPECGGEPIDVRLVPSLRHAHWGGSTFTTRDARWIELPASGEDDAARAVLAHELAHFWLGGAWDALPPVLEEGVAIRASHLAVPAAAARERGELALVLGTMLRGGVEFEGPRLERGPQGSRLTAESARYRMSARLETAGVPPLPEALSLDADALAALRAPGARAALDALAYVLVERIGLDGLHGLCIQARALGYGRVPDGWVWSAARIEPTEPLLLDRAVEALLGPDEVRTLLLRDDLGPIVAAPARASDAAP